MGSQLVEWDVIYSSKPLKRLSLGASLVAQWQSLLAKGGDMGLIPGAGGSYMLWVVSSAYLRLLILLPAILIPACASSSLAFCMMCSAHKLNKQGDNIQPWHTHFPFWNQSVVPCPVLTVASWPAYRFLRRQVRWFGIPISCRIFKSFLRSTQSMALAQSIKQK